jgi:hypothetical protein
MGLSRNTVPALYEGISMVTANSVPVQRAVLSLAEVGVCERSSYLQRALRCVLQVSVIEISEHFIELFF